MATHAFDLQKAIHSALLDSEITDSSGSSITGIFDDVPEGTSYPYITVGEDTAVDVSSKDNTIFEHTLTIHAWSQYKGRRDIKELMEQIHNALHNVDVSVNGASLCNLRQEFQTTLLENDGITRHGVMRFRAVVSDS